MARSVSTDVDAWEIEQPSASYEMSPTIASPRPRLEVQVHPQGHLVPAGRVDVVHLGVERIPQPEVVRRPVVIENDLLVELFHLHGSAHPEESLG